MPELFFEIGTEEIPAGYIGPALAFLERGLEEFFSKNHVKAGKPRAMATPRRLTIAVPGVDPRQEDVVETFLGPSVQAGYDGQGNPTKAAMGFARSKGLEVSALTRADTPKGEVLCARVEKKGQPTETVLAPYLSKLIGDIPFPKKMRWGAQPAAFARPVHWIAALFGGKVLPVEFAGLRGQNASRGHRFLSPGPFSFDSLESYLAECEKRYIVPDVQERKDRIRKQIHDLAEKAGGTVKEDPALLEEVANLVEYPAGLLCDFEPKYLELPRELLAMTMKRHQKYFPVEDKNGNVLPHFIAISNMKNDDPVLIKRGNERVLRARLEDARFFFGEDRKRKLEDFVDRLKGVVFQKDLGTSHEKVTRIARLAEELAQTVCPEAAAKVKRAAWLCKADLVSQMVFEFPELQGTMGGYYAAHSGEDPEVALAVKEHYRPAFAGDRPPSNVVGAAVATADKLDTILGCIGVGLIPSGSEDPYGLRRHSLGVIQIVLDRDWRISLDRMIAAGIEALGPRTKLPAGEIRANVLDLFAQRFKSLFNSEGFPYDAVDAVLSTGIDSFVDVRKKVAAFSELKRQPHFEPLAIAFRRVASILTAESQGDVQTGLFREAAEKDLYEEYLRVRGPAEESIRKKEYGEALATIVQIKSAVDRFFDKVLVMADDETLRKNRLRLLRHVSLLFSQIADFSKIVLKKS
ncbi:MAG: glycine--tRNA ligase subunit beta [Nitrospinae bacterium]|nr:glycine--tRNA ligase subunit beta [Nitrospinota bacterium]